MNNNLADALSVPPAPTAAIRRGPAIQPGEQPSSHIWDGQSGVVCTPATSTVDRPTSWDAYLEDAGLDPALVEVVEPVQVRGWEGPIGEGQIARYHYYRLTVRSRRPGASIDELIKVVKRRKTTRNVPSDSTVSTVFSVDLGDLQFGKIDADGPEGTLTRACDSLERAVDELRRIRRAGTKIDTVKIAWLGDACEGFVSQGGSNAWRTVLTLTEQTRILRRLMLHAVDLFAPKADTVIQLAIPGNHDQAVRLGGKGLTRYDDSFDVEAMVAVADALKMNPETYGHVVTHVPAVDELTVTLDLGGTIVTHAHGHMWRPDKALEWWSGQAFGDQQPGQASVLFSGHLHHLVVKQAGNRTWIQVPALESESTWWRHQKGIGGRPGVVTSVLEDGKVGHIHVV